MRAVNPSPASPRRGVRPGCSPRRASLHHRRHRHPRRTRQAAIRVGRPNRLPRWRPAPSSVWLKKLGSRASVSAVFGEPVARAGITIIPMARVGFGFGAGAGRKQAEVAEGGGGGASAAPVGYIKIRDRNAVFRPIRWWMSLSRWPRLSRDSPHRGWYGVCSGAGEAALWSKPPPGQRLAQVARAEHPHARRHQRHISRSAATLRCA